MIDLTIRKYSSSIFDIFGTSRSLARALICILIAAASAGCSSFGSRSGTVTSTSNTLDGFHVFAGDCMNPHVAGVMSPLLLPFVGNLLSGSMKAIGDNIKIYGDDRDAKYASTVNFEEWGTDQKCLHLVHGLVYTNTVAYEEDTTPLFNRLPLPWPLAVKAAMKAQGLEQNAASRNVENKARQALIGSRALLAATPRFFAEIGVVRSMDKSSYTFRLRALYYGEPLGEGWFQRNSAKALVVTVAPYDTSKKIVDNLGGAYSISLANAPVGTSLLFDEYFRQSDAVSRSAWETPWYKVSASSATGPLTLVGGLTVTTEGSKALGVLGSALSSSAVETSKLIVDKKLDEAKIAAAEKTIKDSEDTLRDNFAAATSTAVTDWAEAKTAYDKCAIATDPADKLTKWASFVKAQVKALASIAKAQPLSNIIKDISFLENPAACPMPTS